MAKDDATGKHKSNGPLTGLLSQLGVARHPIVVLIREKFCTFEGCWMCIANLIVIACRLLASVLCCLGPLVALSWVAGWPFRLPVELFFWPQSASLGGAGKFFCSQNWELFVGSSVVEGHLCSVTVASSFFCSLLPFSLVCVLRPRMVSAARALPNGPPPRPVSEKRAAGQGGGRFFPPLRLTLGAH